MNILQQTLRTAAAAGLAYFTLGALQAESLVLVPATDDRNTVMIEGTSNVRDWDAESSNIEGTIEIESNGAFDPASFDPEAFLAQTFRAKVRIPANSLESDSRRLTSNMHDYLKVSDHRYIEFELKSIELNGDFDTAANSFTTEVKGVLTVTGNSSETTFPVEWTVEDNLIMLKGKAALKMSDFGIDPPRLMFGTMRAADEVSVEFQWVLEQRSN